MALTLPRGYLSKSSVEMHLRCPRQFEYRYIKELKEPPGISMIQGISAHEALAMNNKHKIVQHEDLPNKKVLEKFEDDFDTRAMEVDKWDEPRENVISQSRNLLNKYMNTEAPLIQAVAAEERVSAEIEYPNDNEIIKILGFIDLREEAQICDYKVTGRRKSKTDLEGDIGFGLYSLMSGIRNCYLLLLLKQKEERTCRQPICVEDSQIAWTKQIVLDVARSVTTGHFRACDPTSWACSRKYCGYYHRCRGSKITL